MPGGSKIKDQLRVVNTVFVKEFSCLLSFQNYADFYSSDVCGASLYAFNKGNNFVSLF